MQQVKLQTYINRHANTEWWLLIDPETNEQLKESFGFHHLQSAKDYCKIMKFEILEINWKSPNA